MKLIILTLFEENGDFTYLRLEKGYRGKTEQMTSGKTEPMTSGKLNIQIYF